MIKEKVKMIDEQTTSNPNSPIEVKVRDIRLDALKGFLGILVVAGHVFFAYTPSGESSWVVNFCYSFHMFLFIFISGFLIGNKEHNSKWLWHRFKRIIIPYLIWTTFSFFWDYKNLSVKKYFSTVFLHPAYWYLLVLFLCDCFLFLIKLISKNTVTEIIFSVLFILLFNIFTILHIGDEVESIKMLAIYFPYYFAGYFAKKHELKMPHLLFYFALVLYPLSMILYDYGNSAHLINCINSLLNNLNLQDGLRNNIIKISDKLIFPLYNHYLVAALGCMFWWFIFGKIAKIKIVTFFSFLGKYTLQMYLLAGYFFHNYFANRLLNECFLCIISIILVLIISKIIEKNKVLNRILFG